MIENYEEVVPADAIVRWGSFCVRDACCRRCAVEALRSVGRAVGGHWDFFAARSCSLTLTRKSSRELCCSARPSTLTFAGLQRGRARPTGSRRTSRNAVRPSFLVHCRSRNPTREIQTALDLSLGHQPGSLAICFPKTVSSGFTKMRILFKSRIVPSSPIPSESRGESRQPHQC